MTTRAAPRIGPGLRAVLVVADDGAAVVVVVAVVVVAPGAGLVAVTPQSGTAAHFAT